LKVVKVCIILNFTNFQTKYFFKVGSVNLMGLLNSRSK